MTALVIISHSLHTKVMRTLQGLLTDGFILLDEPFSFHLGNRTDNDWASFGFFKGKRKGFTFTNFRAPFTSYRLRCVNGFHVQNLPDD